MFYISDRGASRHLLLFDEFNETKFCGIIPFDITLTVFWNAICDALIQLSAEIKFMVLVP